MEKYKLNPDYNIQVDYWSNLSQTFILCGCMNPQPEDGANFIPEEELCQNNEGIPCLVLRFKNCTGNVINFQTTDVVATEKDLTKSQAALSVDYRFKN